MMAIEHILCKEIRSTVKVGRYTGEVGILVHIKRDRTIVLTKHGKDICYIKPDKNFIAFGFGEDVNPAREEGAHMHPVAWTITSPDAATEARIRALVEKAVA